MSSETPAARISAAASNVTVTSWCPRPDLNRDTRFRKPLLYPVELRGLLVGQNSRRFAQVCHLKMQVDNLRSRPTVCPLFRVMSTTEQKQQTPTPAEIPFTNPQAMIRYVTDTGKILPRKYTGLSAKHQRAVTRTLKHSRNMLLAQ
jgi:small subunit ribosomal protein S18